MQDDFIYFVSTTGQCFWSGELLITDGHAEAKRWTGFHVSKTWDYGGCFEVAASSETPTDPCLCLLRSSYSYWVSGTHPWVLVETENDTLGTGLRLVPNPTLEAPEYECLNPHWECVGTVCPVLKFCPDRASWLDVRTPKSKSIELLEAGALDQTHGAIGMVLCTTILDRLNPDGIPEFLKVFTSDEDVLSLMDKDALSYMLYLVEVEFQMCDFYHMHVYSKLYHTILDDFLYKM
jgi:hypothetical protein